MTRPCMQFLYIAVPVKMKNLRGLARCLCSAKGKPLVTSLAFRREQDCLSDDNGRVQPWYCQTIESVLFV